MPGTDGRDRHYRQAGEAAGGALSEQDWYAAFLAAYTGGTPRSDGDENDRVVWMDWEEALSRPDVPDLSKKLITAALSGGGLTPIDYAPQREKFGAMTFYAAEK